MDIKEMISSVADKLTSDKKLLKSFKSDSTSTVKKILSSLKITDLKDDILEKIVAGVKAKLNISNTAGILSSVTGLFKKK